MKNAILLPTLLIFCMATFGQQLLTTNPKFKTCKVPALKYQEIQKSEYPKQIKQTPPLKSEDFVTIINLGTGSNAFEYLFKGSFLWADDNLKTITHFHRYEGSTSENLSGYGYEISMDEGLTWTDQVFCISGQPYAPRYLHHGIYNPVGNSDPNEAYITFFGASPDQSNSPDSWGGYFFGRGKRD
jgi:hypothetical protein